MSRHEGVSCDLCMKNNFTGLRYKCLRCNDFDLCSACFSLSQAAPPSSSRHSSNHPMQCILTKTDSNILLGGEVSSHPTSYCCPLCGILGLTPVTLTSHVNNDHNDDDFSPSVLCPICAASPDVDPGHIVDDLALHLSSIHAHDNEVESDSKQLRRINQSLSRTSNQSAYSSAAASSSGARSFVRGSLLHLIDPAIPLPSVTGGLRDVMDPITELLSHLNSVRRLASATQPSATQASSTQPSTAQPSTNPSYLLEASNSRPSQQKEQQASQSEVRTQRRDNDHKRDEKLLLVKFLESQQKDCQQQQHHSTEERMLRCQFIHELFLTSDNHLHSMPTSCNSHSQPHATDVDTSTSFTKLPLSSSISSSLSSSSLLYSSQFEHTNNADGCEGCGADDDDFSSGVGNPLVVGGQNFEEDDEYADEGADAEAVNEFLLDEFASGDRLRGRHGNASSSLAYNIGQRPEVGRLSTNQKRRLDAGEGRGGGC